MAAWTPCGCRVERGSDGDRRARIHYCPLHAAAPALLAAARLFVKLADEVSKATPAGEIVKRWIDDGRSAARAVIRRATEGA